MTTVQGIRTIEHRIAGATTAGDSIRRSPVWEPASGTRQAEVLLAEPSHIDRAAAAAKAAFDTWSEVSLARRARIMFAFRDLVHRRTDDLARIVSSEHGKVFEDAKGEVVRGLRGGRVSTRSTRRSS